MLVYIQMVYITIMVMVTTTVEFFFIIFIILLFQVIEGGSQKGKDLLVDNRGHTFAKKRESKLTTFWTCSVRNKKQRCPATVSQRGQTFIPGKIAHSHPSQPGNAVRAKVASQIKKQATEKTNHFTSSGKMVEAALNSAKEENPDAILPDPTLLQRRANRARQSTRPKHPTTLDFTLDEAHLPEDFLRADIKGSGRHLVFATDDQLKLLSLVHGRDL